MKGERRVQMAPNLFERKNFTLSEKHLLPCNVEIKGSSDSPTYTLPASAGARYANWGINPGRHRGTNCAAACGGPDATTREWQLRI